MFSSPAVADDLVVVGSDDGSVYALDASSGTTRWKRATGGPVRSSPAIAEGAVYVGSNDGNLHAFDLATGEPRWQSPVGFEIVSSPAVAEGRSSSDRTGSTRSTPGPGPRAGRSPPATRSSRRPRSSATRSWSGATTSRSTGSAWRTVASGGISGRVARCGRRRSAPTTGHRVRRQPRRVPLRDRCSGRPRRVVRRSRRRR